jgi:hypothetical protein
MKIKIINVRDRQGMAVDVVTFCKNYIENPERRSQIQMSRMLWGNIKEKRNKIFLFLDQILLALNDNVLNGKEFEIFLNILSKEDKFLLPIIKLIQGEYDHDLVIDDTSIDANAKSTLNKFNVYLEEQRALAAERFKNDLMNDTLFLYKIMKLCPSLIFGLNDTTLKELLSTNSASIYLLVNKLCSNRVAPLLNSNNISLRLVDIFDDDPELTFALLHYLSDKYSNHLETFLSPSIPDSQNFKIRLLALGTKLISFLKKNPEIFLLFIKSGDYLFDFLKLSDNPIDFLSALLKAKPKISEWISENLIHITPYLLNHHSKNNQLVLSFLKNNSFNRMTYLIHLRKTILEKAENVDQQLSEANLLLRLLSDSNLLLTLNYEQKELAYLLRVVGLRSVIEKTVAKHDLLWERYNTTLTTSNDMTMNQEEGYAYVRTLARFINPKILEDKNFTIENPKHVYLITHSSIWQNVTKSILTDPISRQRMEWEKSANDSSFDCFLATFFLSAKGLTWMQNPKHLELFCDLAFGDLYIKYFEILNDMAFNTEHLTGAGINEKIFQHIDTYIQKIFSNRSRSIKLAAALNKKNILIIANYLSHGQFTPWINCLDLLEAILSVEPNRQNQIIEVLKLNQQLILKLFDFEKDDDVYEVSLKHFLEIPDVCQKLFSGFVQSHFLNLINQTPASILIYLVESKLNINNIFSSCIRDNILKITHLDILNYFLSTPKFSEHFQDIPYPVLSTILQTGHYLESRETIFSLLDLYGNQFFKQLREEFALLFKQNKYFAEYFLSNWQILSKFNFSLEFLLFLFFDKNSKETIDYLLSKYEDHYFFSFITFCASCLPANLQQSLKFKSKSSEETNDPLGQRRNLSSTNKKIVKIDQKYLAEALTSFDKQLQEEDIQCSYKSLSGRAAVFLKMIYVKLILDPNTALNMLTGHLLNKTIPFSLDYVPLALILNDQFFSDIPVIAPDQIAAYLALLPANFLDLKQCFDLSNESQQFAFTKTLLRLKRLMSFVVDNFFRLLNESPSLEKEVQLLQVLFLASANFPETVLNFLEYPLFFDRVYSILYQKQKPNTKAYCFSGEILLRLLLLKATIKNHDHVNIILCELYLRPITFSIELLPKITKLFPIKFVLDAQNVNLNLFFLRQPAYLQNISHNDILNLIGQNSESIEMVFIYPHIFNRLDVEDVKHFLATKYTDKTIYQIKMDLEQRALTREIVNSHPLFVQSVYENQSISSTTQIFLALGAQAHTPEIQDTMKEEYLFKFNNRFLISEQRANQIMAEIANYSTLTKCETQLYLFWLILEEPEILLREMTLIYKLSQNVLSELNRYILECKNSFGLINKQIEEYVLNECYSLAKDALADMPRTAVIEIETETALDDQLPTPALS